MICKECEFHNACLRLQNWGQDPKDFCPEKFEDLAVKAEARKMFRAFTQRY